MQSCSNKLIIASAGSGKTTHLVEEALSRKGQRVAFLTYTLGNVEAIRGKMYASMGSIPRGIDVLPWFTFLLWECARPYQRAVYPDRRITTIYFPAGRSAPYIGRVNTANFYFRNGDAIYADKLAHFVVDCEERTGGLVSRRLSEMYEAIFIDEFQDLAGYDLDVVEMLLRSRIRVVMVGDPRQTTYATNQSARNSQYRGIGLVKKGQEWERAELCQMETHARSFRSNQAICDYADALWPTMEPTKSHNSIVTGHDGVFIVGKSDLHEYVGRFAPTMLRYDRKTDALGVEALNFGQVKGQDFDRVLILPHGPIRKYLRTGDLSVVERSLQKFYVAVTRARYSVAFLYDGEAESRYNRWCPSVR